MKTELTFICITVTALLIAVVLPSHAEVVEFIQNSVPPGIVNSVTTEETATEITTVTAPASSSGQSFTYWDIDEGSGSYRLNDPFGRALNPVSLTIYNPSTATANYLPTDYDSDNDGIPDWYELHYLGSLSNSAASDPDGDTYSMAGEHARGYPPHLADAMVDGGISRSRASTTLVVLNPDYFLYQRSSDPIGIHSYSAIVTNGTVDTLPTLGDSGGYRFAYWTADGERLKDDFGRSYHTCNVTITGALTVVAHYIETAEDSDGDGLSDGDEVHIYKTDPNNVDSDGDGISDYDEVVSAAVIPAINLLLLN